MEKIDKIVELGIDIDNINEEELFDDLGVDVISFVESPAIEESFLYFNAEGTPTCDCGDHEFVQPTAGENRDEFIGRCIPELIKEGYDQDQATAICYSYWEEQFDSYTDYPDSVKNNAKKGIELNEKIGNKCATQVGKVRAQQLANGEPISFDTIKRMYSYLERAEVYYDENDTEACGTISYLLWGGKAARVWAGAKIKEIEVEEMSYDETVDAIIDYAENNGEFTTHDDILVDLSKEEFSTVSDILQGLGALDLLTRLNIKRDEPAQTYYRYQGPPAERRFCKAMLRLANRGKIFTQAQIEAMNGLNPQFARAGENSYPVFQWVGGKNCRHYWQKLEVFKNAEGKRVIIVSDPTNGSQRLAGRTWAEKMSSEYNFKIENEDQRIVYGPVMIPNKMILRRDEEGNPFYVYFSKATIKKMAEKFLAQNKLHNTDIEHDGNVVTANTLIESWVSEDMTHDKAYKLGFMLPAGTWYAGFRVNDENLWNDIKEKRVRGFSLAGNFISRL